MHALPTLGLGALLALVSPLSAQGDPTNVVLISIDDVGVEPFGFFPDAFPGTAARQNLYAQAPNIESMALGGLRCTNAYAAPVCSPSRASLLTGRLPQRTGIGTVVRFDTFTLDGVELPNAVAELGIGPGNEEILLPELLNAGGIDTGLVGKVHLALDYDEIALGGLGGYGWEWIIDVGQFDWFAASFRNLNQTPVPIPRGQPWGYWNWIRNKNGLVENIIGDGVNPPGHATTVQVEDALEFISQAQEPFFLYLSFNAPHGPYNKPPAANIATPEYDQPLHGWEEYQQTGLLGQTVWTNYMAMVEDIDLNIGLLLSGMPTSVFDDTLFIVMGDNGTPREAIASAGAPLPTTESEYGSHGNGKDIGLVYQRLLTSDQERFKRSVYQPGVQVPLLFFGKGVTNPGRVTRALVGVEDLFNTVSEVQGVDLQAALPPGHEVDGVSFVPVLDDTVDHLTHERQGRLAQYFQPNGDPNEIEPEGDQWPPGAFKRQSYIHHEAGVGLFKIVREFLPANDLFFKIADADWDPSGPGSDPWELQPLPHGPSDDPVIRRIYLRAARDMKLIVGP